MAKVGTVFCLLKINGKRLNIYWKLLLWSELFLIGKQSNMLMFLIIIYSHLCQFPIRVGRHKPSLENSIETTTQAFPHPVLRIFCHIMALITQA